MVTTEVENLNISLVQADLQWENPEMNRRHLEKMFRLVPEHTDLIILPEMFTTGFTMHPEEVAESQEGETVKWMQEVAAKRDAWLMGSVVVRDADHFYNRMQIVSPAGEVQSYDKRHTFRMAGEHEKYSAGKRRMTFRIRNWRIMPLICYDLRFPAWSRNSLLHDEAHAYDLLVYVANWPQRRVSHWELLLRARAIENQAYVAGVNRVGTDGNEIEYNGGSALVDPLGNHISLARQEEQVLNTTLNFQRLQEYREKFPAWQDADEISIIP